MRCFWARAVQIGAGLAIILVLSLPLTQQALAVTRQIQDQKNEEKAAPSGKVEAAPPVEVINGTSRVMKDFNAQQPAPGVSRRSKATSASTSVEVINGAAQRTVVLNSNQAPTARRVATRHKTGRHHRKRAAASAQQKVPVEVIWGTQKFTRVFDVPTNQLHGAAPEHGSVSPDVIGIASTESRSRQEKNGPVVVGISSGDSQAGAPSTQPVVVGIASSGSRSAVGNTQPVVIGITSSGAQTERNAEPVAVGVAPRPAKRRPYRPAALDEQ
jgi:hypothetical protein